jgi:tetratricopeptide (TPR) repeat protein
VTRASRSSLSLRVPTPDGSLSAIGPEQFAAGDRAELAGDYVAAAAAYRAVSAVANDAFTAEAHFRLGRLSWRQGRFSAALAAFEQAQVLADRAGEVELGARIHNGIGAVHYARGDVEAARAAYDQALTTTRDVAMRGRIVLNLGVLESVAGRLDAAREHYERAHELFEKADDVDGLLLALHNRAMVEADLKSWSLADDSFRTLHERLAGSTDRELTAKTLVNHAEVLIELGALVDAVANCDRAMLLFQELGDEPSRGEALRWRARAHLRADRLSAAQTDALAALRIAVRAGARRLEAEAARDVGVVRLARGDRASASKDLTRALVLFTKLGAEREIEEVRTLLPRATPSRPPRRIDGAPTV